MTKVEIGAGICGFITRMSAVSDSEGIVKLDIESACPNIRNFALALSRVNVLATVATKGRNNPVFEAATKSSLHPACPVPVGIIKAVEVASGLALPKDVEIRIEKE